MGRMVDTPYGPMPGCPDCGLVAFRGSHVCEHGVTPAPVVEVGFSVRVDARTYADLLYGPPEDTPPPGSPSGDVR